MLAAAGLVVVGEAATVAAAPGRGACALRPDAALVDVGLPDGDGVALAAPALRAAVAPARRPDVHRPRRGEPGRRPPQRRRRPSSPRTSCRTRRCARLLARCALAREEYRVGRVDAGARRDRRGRRAPARGDRRGCSPRPASRWSRRPATPTTCCARRSPTSPTSSSPTSRCRPATATTGCARRSSSAASAPRPACSCSRSSTRSSYALDLIGDRPEGVGYLLKERVGDVEAFVDAGRARRRRRQRAGPGGRRPDARPPPARTSPLDQLSPRERDVLARDGRGQVQPAASPRRSSSPRPRSRST